MKADKVFNKLNKSTILISLVWGMIVSLCLVWGYGLETEGSVFTGGIKIVSVWIVLFLLLSVGAYFTSVFLDNKSIEVLGDETESLKKFLITCLFSGIILILWIPAFLAVYPGWFNYDAPWQIYMYRDGNISSHHPVLHTLLLGTIVEKTHLWKVAHGDYAYNYNSSVALYNFFQMIVCALGLGYQCEFIYDRFLRRQGKRYKFLLVVLMLAFFGLFPPIVLLAMSPTKDVLFGIFYLLLVIEIIKIFKENRKPGLLFTLLIILCAIFRQNSLYVFLILMIPFLILLAKRFGRKHFICGLICVVISIIAIALYKGPFYTALNIQPGSKAEFLSVPSQQIVSVYLKHREDLSEEDRLLIEKLFDEEAFEGYRPKLADETKGNINFDELDSNKKIYASLYIRLFFRYPADYIDSFLILNYGLWYPDATMDLYNDGENLFFSVDSQLIIQSSKLPALRDYFMGYKSIKSGVGRVLLMPALSVFLLIFLLLRGCKNKETCSVMIGLVTLLIFATFLLGPCASIRYLYYIYILVPMLVSCSFIRKKG